MSDLDPITAEVIRNALLTAAREMKIVMIRSAYSTILRESGDLSCAILSPDGDVVAQGTDDVPVHIASMPYSLRGALSRVPASTLEQGDVLVQNLPDLGNNHLPDVLFAKPMFVGDRLLGFAACRAHWTDIGGASAGSYLTFNSDYQAEGLRIPPMKIVKRGVLNDDVVNLLMANVRGADQRIGDLHAELAGCNIGERRVLELADRYGPELIAEAMVDILDYAERLTRAEIEAIPDGAYPVYVGHMDGDWSSGGPTEIRVAITVDGSDITVDLRGSAPQTRSAIDAPLAVTASAVHYAVKAATDPWNPANSGSFRPITILTDPGSVVDVDLPSPVVAANHETSNIIADLVFGALEAACSEMPRRVVAAGYASASPVFLAGDTPKGSFVFLEVHAGGCGARWDKDGLGATRSGTGNTGNQPIEVVELEYPVRILEYAIIPDTGGPGRQRGGVASRRVTKVLSDQLMTLVAERSRVEAFGLAGGGPGRLADYAVIRDGQRKSIFSKVDTMPLTAGAVMSIQPSGGGAFGPVSERSRAAVVEDVIDGYVTPSAADVEYGVKLTADELAAVAPSGGVR